ncbi:hypothetical protein ACRAWD_28525 [Caulobacter segnis]
MQVISSGIDHSKGYTNIADALSDCRRPASRSIPSATRLVRHRPQLHQPVQPGHQPHADPGERPPLRRQQRRLAVLGHGAGGQVDFNAIPTGMIDRASRTAIQPAAPSRLWLGRHRASSTSSPSRTTRAWKSMTSSASRRQG